MVRIRLISQYRGNPGGSVLQVEENEASKLVGDMIAVRLDPATNYIQPEHKAVLVAPEEKRRGRPRRFV